LSVVSRDLQTIVSVSVYRMYARTKEIEYQFLYVALVTFKELEYQFIRDFIQIFCTKQHFH